MDGSGQGTERDALGMPIGPSIGDWAGARWPGDGPFEGRHCRVERLAPAHAEALFDAYAEAEDGRDWTYLGYGPFESSASYRRWIERHAAQRDPHFRVIVPRTVGRPEGVASWLRIDPEAGSIEVGHVCLAPALQRTPAATEAMYLMMREAFSLGYRRYEWKCDALNERSRRAALRFGFTFEGVFRQATVYKGRSRDTAWYSVIDREWPALRDAFERWLEPTNFDADGHQRRALESFR